MLWDVFVISSCALLLPCAADARNASDKPQLRKQALRHYCQSQRVIMACNQSADTRTGLASAVAPTASTKVAPFHMSVLSADDNPACVLARICQPCPREVEAGSRPREIRMIYK